MARVQRHRDAALEQRLERALDEALGAAVRRVALADDGEPHEQAPSLAAPVSASSDASAACTRSTGSVVRHSETLPPPQPSRPQGRHECCGDATTRCATRQGPHAISLDGPNSASAGVPIAAAMCIGAESTPANARAQAVSAASSGIDSAPVRSTTRGDVAGRTAASTAVVERALAIVGRAGDDDGKPVRDDEVEQRGRALGRPALEQPARARDAPARIRAAPRLLGEQAATCCAGRRARDQDQARVRLVGIHADAPQRVQILLDHVALGARGQPVEMGEVARHSAARFSRSRATE